MEIALAISNFSKNLGIFKPEFQRLPDIWGVDNCIWSIWE